MPDQPLALNLVRILNRLVANPRGWRVDLLKSELGIADRTYRKYRGLLRDELGHVSGPGGRWKVVEVQDGQATYLRLLRDDGPAEDHEDFLAQVAAFWMAGRLFEFTGRAGLGEAANGAWADLLAGVRDKAFYEKHLLRNTDRMLHVVPDAPKDYAGHEDVVADLLRGIFFRWKLRLVYRNNTDETPRTRVVCPLTLVLWRSALYLVAAFTPTGRPYLFAVEHIESVERQDKARFEYPGPADYDPETLFEGSFGIYQEPDGVPTEVELLFAPQRWLERYVSDRTWHPSQEFTRTDDGRLRMTFTVTSMVEVWPWIRSFGDDVEVVRPVEPSASEPPTP